MEEGRKVKRKRYEEKNVKGKAGVKSELKGGREGGRER